MNKYNESKCLGGGRNGDDIEDNVMKREDLKIMMEEKEEKEKEEKEEKEEEGRPLEMWMFEAIDGQFAVESENSLFPFPIGACLSNSQQMLTSQPTLSNTGLDLKIALKVLKEIVKRYGLKPIGCPPQKKAILPVHVPHMTDEMAVDLMLSYLNSLPNAL